MSAVATMVRKEWAEMVRSKVVLSVILVMPIVVTAIPVVTLALLKGAEVSASDYEDLGPLLDDPRFAGLTPVEAMQSILASNMLVMFLLMPIMVPLTIATYSIVGEKMSRSLEPLLATPITTLELLAGKAIAAAVPGVATAWLSFGLFLIGARVFSASDAVFAIFVDPMWFVAMVVLAPALTVMAVSVGVIVSSRTTDPRAAEQLGGIIVLPLVLVLVGVMTGFLRLSTPLFWAAAAVIILADVGLVLLGARLFQRETILTRWK